MKYRKKPVIIEAFQITQETRLNNIDWPEWLNEAWNKDRGEVGSVSPSKYPVSDGNDELFLRTPEGLRLVSFNDFIIQGVNGELCPCKPDIFEKTYEPVEN